MMLKNEQISGLVLGAMAGDCLGIPYLYMKADALFEMGRHLQWEIGMPGECSHVLYQSLDMLAHKGMHLEHIAQAYWKWGQSCQDMSYVMSECFGGKKKKAATLQAQAKSADYGTLCSGLLLIRQIPLVCASLDWIDEKLCQWVEEECHLTHWDAECVEYAQLYALCLRDILLGKTRLEIWDHLFEAVKTREAYRSLLSSYYEKPACDGADYSHAGVTFAMALYHFWHNTPVSCAIRSAVLSGGATDVNACATGVLCGASQGLEAIPETWRDVLLYELEPPHTQLASHTIHAIELLQHGKSTDFLPVNALRRPQLHTRQNPTCAPYAQGA